MEKSSLLKESFLCNLIKFIGSIFCQLPYGLNLKIGRVIGLLGFWFLPKKRSVIESNLRIVFPSLDRKEILRMTKEVFKNFTCNFIDLLRFPKIKNEGFQEIGVIEGYENFDLALASGKGAILLAVHSGSWELASLVSSMKHPYSVIANEQQKAPALNEMLNDYRRLAGAKVIPPGTATRDIIRAIQNNEIVCLVLDQGGKDGTPVKLFGKTASMSTGAVRLALKYQTPICPGWIHRRKDGKQIIKFFPPVVLTPSGNEQKDVFDNTQRFAKFYEDLLRDHPTEYMWFYKVYKYSTELDILIIDDGKTGHLRQSQAIAEDLRIALEKKGKDVRITTVGVEFKNRWLLKIFPLYCFFAQYLVFLRTEAILEVVLKEKSYKSLLSLKPDYIVSCASQGAGINFILSRLSSIKAVHVLKPGLLKWKWFFLGIVPEHDMPQEIQSNSLVLTKLALNLITPQYLENQEKQITIRYPHLKLSVRNKVGLLLGGNTKGVNFDIHQIRFLIKKLKEAAFHYNLDLLVTTSRRTPKDIDEMIIKELREFERCSLLIIANENNIPEAVGGILSLSDYLIVSGESISMVSEAIASGKKTIVFSPIGQYPLSPLTKYDYFVLGLNQQGYLLASSIKDISESINQIMNQKIIRKVIDDKKNILQAMESLV